MARVVSEIAEEKQSFCSFKSFVKTFCRYNSSKSNDDVGEDSIGTIGFTTANNEESQYDFSEIQGIFFENEERLLDLEEKESSGKEDFTSSDVEEITRFVESLDEMIGQLTLIAKTARAAGFVPATDVQQIADVSTDFQDDITDKVVSSFTNPATKRARE